MTAAAYRPDPALDVSEAISLVLDGEDYEGAPYCAMETLGSDGPEEYGCACEEWTDLSGITWGQHVAEKVVARLSRSAGEQNRGWNDAHRQADELGHGSDGRMFHEATCPRCGLMLAYLVRDQVECAASHPAGEQRP